MDSLKLRHSGKHLFMINNMTAARAATNAKAPIAMPAICKGVKLQKTADWENDVPPSCK